MPPSRTSSSSSNRYTNPASGSRTSSSSRNNNPLNNPKVVGGTSYLYASYADHYYAELQSKGFVAAQKDADDNIIDDSMDMDECLEYDEGYAIADKGEAPPKEVNFSRPRSPKKKGVYSEVYDSEAMAEYARAVMMRSQMVARRAQAEAWRELSFTLRSIR